MKDNFILPKYWYLKIDDSNRDLIKQWRKDRFNYTDDISTWNYVNSAGWQLGGRDVITTDEFINHILKQPINSLDTEDFSYLITLFKTLNIK